MQDGKVEVDQHDITTNLPYVPGVHLAFDHHQSETLRHPTRAANHVIDPRAPSAARVVYEYYGGRQRFPAAWDGMMVAVDKADSAQFSRDEILDPRGWVLLNFLMDARTGLGRFHQFRISNYELMMALIDACRSLTIDEILALPDVDERMRLYGEHEDRAKKQIARCATVHGDLVVLDLRQEETIHAINRFVIYAMYPEASVSMHVMWGVKRQNTVFAIGKSIVTRSSDLDIGALCLAYGGGGHRNAGTCQVDNAVADSTLAEIVLRVSGDANATQAARAARELHARSLPALT